DFGKVFPDFIWRSDASRFLTTPEALNLRATFLLPDHAGRLHSTIRQAVRRQDGKPILVFELMVRGIGQDKSQDAMWAWFDLAREWIVKGFSDFTSGEVQRGIWRRLQ
ncbi:MAG: hypothetical protein ACXWWJ_08600, partial [Nitrospira sp.]